VKESFSTTHCPLLLPTPKKNSYRKATIVALRLKKQDTKYKFIPFVA